MVETPFAWTRLADTETLKKLLTETYQRQFSEPGAAVYLERPEWVDLLPVVDLDVTLWPRGRAFSHSLELRWAPTSNGYQLHLLAERSDLVIDNDWQQLNLVANQITDRIVLLWGTHRRALPSSHHLYSQAADSPDEWIETRLPRPLRYPMSGQSNWVRLRVRDYQRDGMILLTRLQKVEGY